MQNLVKTEKFEGFIFGETEDVVEFNGGKCKKTIKKAKGGNDKPKEVKMPKHMAVAIVNAANAIRSAAEIIVAEYSAKTTSFAQPLYYINGPYTCARHVSYSD